jgi:hypothetical protein
MQCRGTRSTPTNDYCLGGADRHGYRHSTDTCGIRQPGLSGTAIGNIFDTSCNVRYHIRLVAHGGLVCNENIITGETS